MTFCVRARRRRDSGIGPALAGIGLALAMPAVTLVDHEALTVTVGEFRSVSIRAWPGEPAFAKPPRSATAVAAFGELWRSAVRVPLVEGHTQPGNGP